MGGQVLDARQRLPVAVETRRLQAEKRLLLTQVMREGAEAEDITVVSAERKDGRA